VRQLPSLRILRAIIEPVADLQVCALALFITTYKERQ